jgi:hypothetical protein
VHLKPLVAVATILTFQGASAWAEATTSAQSLTPAAAATPAAQEDRARQRWGVSAGGGLERVEGESVRLFGLDFRLGVQLNNLLAFYLQPHLSLGSGSGGTNEAGTTQTAWTCSIAGMAEATFMDRFFAAAGFGYGIPNANSGAMLQARLGGYPLMARGANGIRRKGLMIGVDLRTIFVEGATAILVLGAVGYEAF